MPDSGTVSRVSHEVVVDRVIGAVFDVVTTARYWPQWHPATRAVEGDIDRPARLGDEIIEHVTIAGREGFGTWTVVEHDPPNHLALESDTAMGHLRISCPPWAWDGRDSDGTWIIPISGRGLRRRCGRSPAKAFATWPGSSRP